MSKISTEDYTKALETIKKFQCQCSNCGTQFGDRWEWSANSFTLHLNIDCQSTDALFGDRANEIGFKHPAIQKGAGYQKLTLAATLKDDTTDDKRTLKRQTKCQPFAK